MWCPLGWSSSLLSSLSPFFWSWKKEDAVKTQSWGNEGYSFSDTCEEDLVMSWENLILFSNLFISGISWSFNISETLFQNISKISSPVKILGTLSYTWVLSLEDLTCLTVLYFALKCSQFRVILNFRSETLLLKEMIHQALGFHGPTLKFTGWNQENKAVILKMLPRGPYLGERTQAKKYLIIK